MENSAQLIDPGSLASYNSGTSATIEKKEMVKEKFDTK